MHCLSSMIFSKVQASASPAVRYRGPNLANVWLMLVRTNSPNASLVGQP